MIESGELGDVRYIYGQRLNLGRIRADENALWSLGAHDVSVLLSLAGELPVEASARGEDFIQDGVEDVVFGYLQFPSGMAGHLHLSWLDPHKVRKITVVGANKMATLDDMDMDRKLTVYDKGFDAAGELVRRSRVRDPLGHGLSPPDPEPGAARGSSASTSSTASAPGTPRARDGHNGARVVRVLEALQSSLDAGGAPQPVGEPAVSA